jgi:uncharacterized protein (DUF885 family)
MKKLTTFMGAVVLLGIVLGGCKSSSTAAIPTISEPSATPAIEIQSTAISPTAEKPVEPQSSPTEISASADFASSFEGLNLAAFFETSFQALTLRSPETVVSVGLTEIYGVSEILLDDISSAYQEETYALVRAILEQLRTYERAELSPEDQISYDIYEWYLEDYLAGQTFRLHQYPATYFPVTAIHEDTLQFFTDVHPVTSLVEAQDYVTRLQLVGPKIEQLIELLETAAAAGIEPPKFAIQWTLYGNFGQFVGTPARATDLYKTFKSKVDLLSSGTPESKAIVLEEAETAIEMIVLPAYRKLHNRISELPYYAGADSGVWRLPQGESYYAYRLRHSTTTDLTAAEIHNLGLSELDRIHADMRAIFAELGYPPEISITAAYDRVAVEGGHIAGQDVLTTYKRLIVAADQNIAPAFDIRPAGEVVVIGDDFGGFYLRGSIDGSRPGAFYAAVNETGEPYYAMPTLAYHEAIPGHHFQIALAMEMQALPSFRQGIGFNAFAEGWALYAEQLAYELGWYADDPYGHLGLLQAMAFRAARLVVDSGLHAEGWTFDQAQEFFTENTGFEVGDPVNPQHQIARYLVWPGQATSYYVGYLKIMELRQHARTELGEKFDLKDFHRVILGNGSMPLAVLDRVVADYIATELDS